LVTGNQYSTKEEGDNQHDTVPLELPTIANAKNHENAQRKYNQDTENICCPRYISLQFKSFTSRNFV
jgi:hypothetical protein